MLFETHLKDVSVSNQLDILHLSYDVVTLPD